MDILNTKINNILTEKTLKIRPENIKSGISILGISGNVVELNGETKTITPTTSQQTITPSQGKNGITQATIEAVTSSIDANITAGNIKKDVTILNVTGTYEGTDTSDANAVANDIVTGKTAYVNGQKLTGTYTGIIPTGTKSITQNGTVDVSQYASANVNVPTPSPTLQSKSVTITENGTTTITADSGYDGLDEVEVTTNVSGGTSEYNAKVRTEAITDPNISYPSIRNIVVEVPAINLGNFTTCQSFFSNNYYLEKVEVFDTSKVTNMSSMFQNCSRLSYIPEFNTSRVTTFQNCWNGCNSLNDDALNNILAMCYKSAVTNNKTLSYAGLNSEQRTRCESLPNWNAFSSAGWFKGN